MNTLLTAIILHFTLNHQYHFRYCYNGIVATTIICKQLLQKYQKFIQ